MTWEEALELVVARTGHHPYRERCSESSDRPPPNDYLAYRALMLRMAEDPDPPETMSAAESHQLVKRMIACPFHSRGHECDCGRCALRGGSQVSHLDCFACLKQYGQ